MTTLINRQGGFTVFELVMVIVITGVLGMIALPRLHLSSQFEQHIQADNLVGLLRLAQLRAMNDPNALNAIGSGAEQTQDVNRHCAIIAMTATGISLAKNCAHTGIASLLSADALKAAHAQGLFAGQLDISLTVNAPYQLPLYLAFGEAGANSAGNGTQILAEASWLGQPFVDGSALSTPLIVNVGKHTLRIEPEGYIHAN